MWTKLIVQPLFDASGYCQTTMKWGKGQSYFISQNRWPCSEPFPLFRVESLFLVGALPIWTTICCWFPEVCMVVASPKVCLLSSLDSSFQFPWQNPDIFKPKDHTCWISYLIFSRCIPILRMMFMYFPWFSPCFLASETQPIGTKKARNPFRSGASLFAPFRSVRSVPRGAFVENPRGLGPGWGDLWVPNIQKCWDLLRDMKI